MAKEKQDWSEKAFIGGIAVTVVAGMIGTAALSTLFNGVVVSILWQWFVATQFKVPAITIPEAIGLVAMVRLFAPEVAPAPRSFKVKSQDSVLNGATLEADGGCGIALWGMFGIPAFVLLTGWIIHYFFMS